MEAPRPVSNEPQPCQAEASSSHAEAGNCPYRRIFLEAGVGIAEIDARTLRILRTNQAFSQALGQSQEALAQLRFSDLGMVTETSEANDAHTDAERIAKLCEGKGQSCTWYASYGPAERPTRNFKITATKLTDENRNTPVCILVLDDVTERKQTELELQRLQRELEHRVKQRTAELEAANEALRIQAKARKQIAEALRQSVALYRTIAASIPDAAVLVVDQDRRFRVAEGKLLPALGTPRNQIEGAEIGRESYGSVGRLFVQVFEEALSGKTASFERTVDNRLLYVVHTPLRSAEADIVGAVALILDVSARKHIEQRYWEVISTANEGIWFFDGNFATSFLNEQMANLLGHPRTEVLHWSLLHFVFPEDIPVFQERLLKLASGVDQCYEARFRKQDGTEVWLRVSAKALHDERGFFCGAFGMFTDVSEQRAAEERLRKSEQRFRLLTEASMEGIIVYSMTMRRVRYANPAACQMLGYSDEELCGRTISDLYSTRHASYDMGAGIQGSSSSKAATGELFRKDGSRIRVGMKSVVLELEGERCPALFLTDLTTRSLLDQERAKAQKLEALGTLAGGIAHDFNNLLQAVFANISLVRWSYDDRSEALSRLAAVEHSLQLAIKLTGQLLAFSKGGTLQRKPLSLGPLLGEATSFVLSGTNAIAHVEVAKDLWTVEADEGALTQVMHNILLNANQAMPHGGTISVTARNIEAPSTGTPVLIHSGRWVEITVKDTGVGIEEEHISRIFDPYFSTKPTGTGLGLSTTYAIVHKHDGVIDVKSKPHKGTTVAIYLPATDTRPELQPTPKDTTSSRPYRVLLLDDEQDIRETSAAILHALGHRVVSVATGEAVLAAYRSAAASAERFDLAILDLTIRGGMGGMETLRALRALDKDTRAILTSGYSDDVVSIGEHPFQAKYFLPKPYTMNQLRDMILALMEAPGHAT